MHNIVENDAQEAQALYNILRTIAGATRVFTEYEVEKAALGDLEYPIIDLVTNDELMAQLPNKFQNEARDAHNQYHTRRGQLTEDNDLRKQFHRIHENVKIYGTRAILSSDLHLMTQLAQAVNQKSYQQAAENNTTPEIEISFIRATTLWF